MGKINRHDAPVLTVSEEKRLKMLQIASWAAGFKVNNEAERIAAMAGWPEDEVRSISEYNAHIVSIMTTGTSPYKSGNDLFFKLIFEEAVRMVRTNRNPYIFRVYDNAGHRLLKRIFDENNGFYDA